MKYFGMNEFVCKHCGRLPEQGMSTVLLERLDKLRELYGRPIMVSSAYRCPVHNANVGGVPNSQHVMGTACDIYVDGDYEEFYNLVRVSNLFDGVGHYPYSQFVHVDVRDNGNSPNCYLWEG